MFCNSCGKELENGMEKCPQCGAEIVREVITKPTETPDVEQIDVAEINNERVDMEQINPDEILYPKKKKGKKAVIALVAVLVLGMIGYFARANLMIAFVPKHLVAMSLANTFSQLEAETTQFAEEFFGFKLDKNTDFTEKMSLSMPSENVSMTAKAAHSATDKAIYGEVEIDGNGQKVNMNMLWNDEIIGYQFPFLAGDTYFAVSSKNFGDQLMNTKISQLSEAMSKIGLDLSGLDLSYSNVTRFGLTEEEAFKHLEKKFRNCILDFIKSGEILDKDSEDIDIDGKERSALCATVLFEGEDLQNFLVNYTSIIEKDAKVKEMFGKGYVNFVGKIREGIEEQDIEGEYEVDFLIYKNKVVGIKLEADEQNFEVEWCFTNSKCLIDGMYVELTAGNGQSVKLETTGNMMPVKGKMNPEIAVSAGGQKLTAGLEADFKAGKSSVYLNIPGGQSFELDGKCSNKDGFEFSVEENGVEFALSIKKGAKIGKLDGKKYMIFEHTEEELQSKLSGGMNPSFGGSAFDNSSYNDFGVNPGMARPSVDIDEKQLEELRKQLENMPEMQIPSNGNWATENIQ